MTPSGIEPATFRFVAQHLNHCVTAVLHCGMSFYILLSEYFFVDLCAFRRECEVCPGGILLRNGKTVALNTHMQQAGSGEVFLNCILNVRISNLCWGTSYSDCHFRSFLQLLHATAWTATLATTVERTVGISEERD